MTVKNIDAIIQYYESVVKTADQTAEHNKDRAYGGFVRATKGVMLENITESLIKIAWQELAADEGRLVINKTKINIPIVQDYIDNMQDNEIKQYIQKNISDYTFKCSVDKHVYIDNTFVLAVECKAYAENAMLKRILVDFHLLKTMHPDLQCVLLQLESQLGGDYAQLAKNPFGSKPSHTLMSYFNLQILTLLKGERKVDRPIYKPEYYKPLSKTRVQYIKSEMKQLLTHYL